MNYIILHLNYRNKFGHQILKSNNTVKHFYKLIIKFKTEINDLFFRLFQLLILQEYRVQSKVLMHSNNSWMDKVRMVKQVAVNPLHS